MVSDLLDILDLGVSVPFGIQEEDSYGSSSEDSIL